MTETIASAMNRLMTPCAELQDYRAENGLLYCGNCNTPKEASSWIAKSCLAVTAIRQNVSAKGLRGKNRKPRKRKEGISKKYSG